MLTRKNALLALLALTPGVEAADLNTAIIYSGGNSFVNYRCTLTNLGTKPIAARITLVDNGGA